VLDGMIIHTTHGTEFLQHITITMAIPNITPATAVRRTQVTISRGTRLTSLTPPPYGDLKPPTQLMGTSNPQPRGEHQCSSPRVGRLLTTYRYPLTV